jgi:predicted RNA-binding Zn ribbon-like protein
MTQPFPGRQFDISGGNPALDFVNTISSRPTPERLDRLSDYPKLVVFGEEAGVLSQLVANRLYRIAGEVPGHGETALQQAVRLREALFDIFSAAAEHRAIPGNALALLNFAVQESAAHLRIVHTNHRFVVEWIGMDSYLDSLLWPIARAAANLLTSDELANLRICASDDCAWLFLDQTKNHRRRWCDMKTCGNRVKARRHYERMKRA